MQKLYWKELTQKYLLDYFKLLEQIKHNIFQIYNKKTIFVLTQCYNLFNIVLILIVIFINVIHIGMIMIILF